MNFLDKYNERKSELTIFLNIMKTLYEKEVCRTNGKTEFDIFFGSSSTEEISYTQLSNILKSNACLMIYNLIEFTVVQLFTEIYDLIQQNQLGYKAVDDSIKKIWIKTQLKSAKDPSIKLSTLNNKTEQIISCVLKNTAITLNTKDTLNVGNMDLTVISEIFEEHNIKFSLSPEIHRPDKFSTIKLHRNNLAHGSSLFSEELADSTINDIEKDYHLTVKILDSLILQVSNYINNESFKIN